MHYVFDICKDELEQNEIFIRVIGFGNVFWSSSDDRFFVDDSFSKIA